jgi:hypothetical protein
MTKDRKTPQEKKRLSLKRDRRNVNGENDKSSRKNIPRSKALAQREVRRRAAEIERSWSRLDESDADTLELTLVTPNLQKPPFRKYPDAPLGEVLRYKSRSRSERAGRRKR